MMAATASKSHVIGLMLTQCRAYFSFISNSRRWVFMLSVCTLYANTNITQIYYRK